ncbi:bile acid:sodium symporter family protein [Mycobacterium sp. DL592]|uniref:bile acid:sodium symporter family protein n=1 Tax=Mycobacterium sp. DL592 TaxID=2675524 RepID=UPI001FBAF404|nr:membrane transporter protein [Mycobacterium sp. DL592]
MNWAAVAKLAFGLSLAVMVFGSGLGARFSDVTALLRRPGLLARSLIAVLVVAPVLAVVLVKAFDVHREVAIALVALSISPLPPLLPGRGAKAGGRHEYGLGLVLMLAVLAVPVIVAAAAILEAVFGRDYVAMPWSIARLLALSILAPLLAGMLVARFSPSTAKRLAGPIVAVQRWLLPIAMIALLVSSAPEMWSLLGGGTLLAVAIFVVGALGIGHLLGGPDRRDAAVLAFATACRHPATALALASANFPTTDEHAAIALYGLVTAVAGGVYTLIARRWLPSRSSP